MEPADRARRAGARVVDLVTVAWVTGVVVVEVEGRLLDGDPLAVRAAQPVTSGQVLVSLLAVVVALEVVPVAVWGRSVGKALLGLRVVVAGVTEPGVAAGRDVSGERPARVGVVRSTLRALTLLGPLAVPYVGGPLAVAVALSALVLPGGRGVHDLVAGTAVVGSLPGAGAPRRGRHRYPRRAIDPLPLPEVARTALVEVGVPHEVPGAFTVDVRMAVFDETLFSVGEDPSGRSLCVVSPSGEVVAIDPDGTRPPLLAGSSLPRFLDALDALGPAEEPQDARRRRVDAADPGVVDHPDSWWATVLPA